MKLSDVIWSVEKRAVAALGIFSVLAGAYIELDYVRSTGLGGGGMLFLLGSIAAFLIGFVPVVAYGGLVYAYHLVQPRFGFTLVLVASFVPGLIWVLVNAPDRNVALFLGAGPSVATILHLLCRKLPGPSGDDAR